jgi:large subunit ribosomal protein L25
MAEALQVELRQNRGKRKARQLRRSGAIPAVLYGHGQESVSLTVPREAFVTALRHGTRLVDLQGAVSESALIRELQWDTFGVDVLHIDFARVSADERITVTVAVELRGQSPGVRAGGVVQHLVHQAEIECLATAIPEKLQVNINHLELLGTITLGQMELPQGVAVVGDPEAIVVQCVEPVEEVEAEAGTEGAEPEVIGRKPDEEEAAE